MIQIPRVNAPIGASGFNFTPDQFPRWVAFIAAQIEALELGSGGSFDPLIVGYGRIAGADYFGADLTAPRLPSSPARALEIPNATWLVQSHRIVIDEPDGALLLSDIPANMAGKYGYVSTREIEDSGGEFTLEILPENWFDALQPQLSAAGLVCIGTVTSDSDSVTAIDGAQADVIVPLPVLLRQILALGGAGQNGGQPAPTGEVTRTEFNALKAQVEALAALVAALSARIGVPGTTTLISDIDRYLTRDVARLEVEAVETRAAFSLEIDASVFIPGKAGDGYDLGNGLISRDVHSGNTHLDFETEEES